jgi:dihydropyrimidinase
MAKDFYENYIKNRIQTKSEEKPDYLAVSKEEIVQSIADSIMSKINYNTPSTDPILYDLVITDGMVIAPGIGITHSNIGIKDGRIASITNMKIHGNNTVNAKNMYVCPGIIDPHIHLGLFSPFEVEVETETKAAIAGGVTTAGCFFGSQVSHLESFPELESKIQKLSHIDIIPHLVIGSQTQKRELKAYVEQLGITSFKLYMNGIPGIIEDIGDGFMLDVFDEIKKISKPCMICVHTENREVVRRATSNIQDALSESATIKDWTETHPDMAEEEAVNRLSYFAKKMGVHVYIVHLSSKGAVKNLKAIKADNPYVHVETTSPYLSINHSTTNSSLIKMEPPFRGSDDMEALWEGVRNGVIDTIGTDNVTMTTTEKNSKADNLWHVMPGYPAIETHLPVLLHEGVYIRKIPIEKIIEKITKNPAEQFGVYPQKGSMLTGSDADITIIDMDKSKKVTARDLHSRSDFSLYEGKVLHGWPVITIKSGKIVYQDEKFTGEKAQCNYLKR